MVRWFWSVDTLFWQLSINHNIDVQYQFTCAPKLARKCEIERWYATIYRPHTFELNSIAKYQLLFLWKSFENIWPFILYLDSGETELINGCVVPFAIDKFSQKCLEAASTLKYEPLNSCITVHSVWIMKIFNIMFPNTCSRNKRRKNCEESRWRSQSALVRPLAMPCLNRCQYLIGS